MAADQNGFDPYPGSLKHPGLASFVGQTANWKLSDSVAQLPDSFTGARTKVLFYEGER